MRDEKLVEEIYQNLREVLSLESSHVRSNYLEKGLLKALAKGREDVLKSDKATEDFINEIIDTRTKAILKEIEDREKELRETADNQSDKSTNFYNILMNCANELEALKQNISKKLEGNK